MPTATAIVHPTPVIPDGAAIFWRIRNVAYLYTLLGYTRTGCPKRGGRDMSETIMYEVPGVHCAHCEAAIKLEVGGVEGVESVVVDLEAKRVTVSGSALDDARVRAAIDQAGYDVAP